MPNLGRVRAHLRAYWHIHAAWISLSIAIVVIVFTGGAAFKVINGVKLNKNGQQAYAAVAAQHRFEGQPGDGTGARIREALPPKLVKQLERANSHVHTLKPLTLATPEPVTFTRILDRNYSSTAPVKKVLFVVHDAEMPNYPKLQSLLAIVAWFNNPQAQASANWSTDQWGNTVQMVPCNQTAKAWHVAFFNPWACGDELIGYASQTSWPDAQLRAVAKLNAAFDAANGVPVQRGLVSGCTIIRPGTVEHADLGGCGGGHHDPGLHFPMTHYLQLVRQYRYGGYHPVAKKHARKIFGHAPELISENGAGQKHLNLRGRR